MFLVVRRTRAPEGIPNVIRGAARMTVVVAVSRAVWFANAEVVFACVVTSEATGRTLHKIVLAANWTVVCEGNVFINIERPLRSTTVSAKRPHARSRRRIVSRLPLWRRRHFVREIIQLPGRQFGQLTTVPRFEPGVSAGLYPQTSSGCHSSDECPVAHEWRCRARPVQANPASGIFLFPHQQTPIP